MLVDLAIFSWEKKTEESEFRPRRTPIQEVFVMLFNALQAILSNHCSMTVLRHDLPKALDKEIGLFGMVYKVSNNSSYCW